MPLGKTCSAVVSAHPSGTHSVPAVFVGEQPPKNLLGELPSSPQPSQLQLFPSASGYVPEQTSIGLPGLQSNPTVNPTLHDPGPSPLNCNGSSVQ